MHYVEITDFIMDSRVPYRTIALFLGDAKSA